MGSNPRRVSLATVGKAGLAQEAWLATRGSDYGSQLNGQICLSGAAGRKWMLDQLVTIMETIRPDYLKWDNNFWIEPLTARATDMDPPTATSRTSRRSTGSSMSCGGGIRIC